ncbi:mesoderm induction early response protein 3 isoform X2 [Chanos chanos]|uniref:Mesoderm induction early response protein 3 isoform X2 n=1 Tax=Chanos chanos TaxID=29144 RepID=A0A6J2VR16_CHACN|nr:mesoderm induction early response protein 3-like isoform X2 [Chanos chanos]
MAEASFGSSSPVGSLSSEDHDFDPTAEMLVHEFDDERTLEEEEYMDREKNFSAEIADLEKEGNMPLEELLAMYRYEASVNAGAGSSMDSSSGELTDDLPDMTLDKEEIAKDLLSGDYEEETQSSADDLTPSVTSHEATDFFPRTLRSNTTYDGDKESEGEEDGVSPEDSRKEIMVGSQYQAEVPAGLSCYEEGEKAYEEEDQLLWSPGVLSESKVKDYLCEALTQSTDGRTENIVSGGHVRDNEQALYELVKCNYNTQEALERYCSNVKSSKDSPPWSEDECRNFEHALQIYDKNFHLIQKHKVQTRTVAECVAFYYMWKKSERFDYFVQQNRFGKKKYSSYPGVTDLMDRLVDEAEGLAVDGTSSLCSGAGGGRMEVSAEQQLGLLNTITASDLTALSNSVATVCNPAEVNCLESTYFPPLESLHRGALNHEEPLGFATNGETECLNALGGSGFYRSDLNQISVCGSKDCERPSKRLKMGLPEPFINDVSVANLGVDFDGRCGTHRITGAKMAVSVTDFGSIAGGESNGFIGSHPRHHQHTALQSE